MNVPLGARPVVVTGATGFVGRALCERLAADGFEIRALTRDAASAERRIPVPVRATSWDAMREPPSAEPFEGARAVVHLAGESVSGRWSASKKKRILESRRDGTRNLVSRLLSLGDRPEVLVSASAIGYYGDRGEEILDESCDPGGGFLAEVCRVWESEATRASQAGIRVVLLRIGIVVGPGGGALEAMLPPFRLGAGGPLGNGRQWWSWVGRDDVVGSALHAMESDLSGPLNVTAPRPVRQREFARALGRAMSRPSFMPAPAIALRIALGEFAGELLSSARVIPAGLTASGFRHAQPDLGETLASSLH